MSTNPLSLRALLESVGRKSQAARIFQPGYVASLGYHCYAEIKLTKKLSAPETKEAADRCLQAILTATRLAAGFAALDGGELLEAQGEIIHVTFPTSGNRQEDYKHVLNFSHALMNSVYEELNRICADDWKGMAMAADFGESVILTTHNYAVTSLGPVANRPAKKLAEGVPSGNIAIRTLDAWTVIPIRGGIRETHTYIPEARFTEKQREVISSTSKADVQFLNSFDKTATNSFAQKKPIAVFGHILRADLHGFTSRVENAFTAPDRLTAIRTLVQEFQQLVLKAEGVFTSTPNHQTTLLPWAGDCLNGVVYPALGEHFVDSQENLPPQIGAHWHPHFSASEKWTLGIAGGDAEDATPANNGRVILATIPTDERDFLVAVGWGVGMSIRAQEAKGGRPLDTIIPVEDYRPLAVFLKPLFAAMDDPRYYRASSLTPEKLQATIREAGTAKTPSNVSVPSAKPWLTV